MGYFLSGLITIDDNLTMLYSALEKRSSSTHKYLVGQPDLSYADAKDYALQHCSPEAEEEQLNAIRNDSKKYKQRTQCPTCKRFHKGPCRYRNRAEANKYKKEKEEVEMNFIEVTEQIFAEASRNKWSW